MPNHLRLRVSRFFLAVCAGAVLGFVLLFLVYPLGSVQSRMGSATAAIDKYYGFLLFALSVTAAAAFGLREWFRTSGSAGGAVALLPAVSPTPRWALALQIFLACFIFTRALLSLDAPLDWDEVARTAELTQGHLWQVMHPFTTMNHPIATALAAFSLDLAGLSKASLRAPTLLILAGGLVGWLWLSLRYFGPVVGCFVLAHLAVNALASWYFHSMRGYLTLMVASLSLLWVVWHAVASPSASRRRSLVLPLLFLTTLLTHAFANFVCAALVLTVLLWACMRRDLFSASQRTTIDLFLLSSLGILLCLGLVMASQLGVLSATGFLFRGLEETHPLSYKLSRTAMLFGVSSFWVVKVVVLLSVAVGWARATRLRDDFLGMWLCISAVMVGACLMLLKVEILEGRMLLAFLIPWLIWLGRGVMEIRQPALRMSLLAASFAALLLPPTQQTFSLMNGDVAHFAGHEAFTLELERRGVNRNCVTVSGDPESAYFAQHLYFQFLPPAPTCEKSMWAAHFSKGQFGEVFPPSIELQRHYRPEFEDGQGRTLFFQRESDKLAQVR